MPPVREASTKPSAATVLPAPVACSNQKRRAAPASSSTESAAASSSASSAGSQSSGSSSGSSSPSSSTSPEWSSSIPALPLPLRPIRSSASSAIRVPDSASTWWADSVVPSARCGSSSASRRSRPEHQRELPPPLERRLARGPRRSPSARRRARAPARALSASAVAASSPSSTKDSRANFSARFRSSPETGEASATELLSATNQAFFVKGDVPSCSSGDSGVRPWCAAVLLSPASNDGPGPSEDAWRIPIEAHRETKWGHRGALPSFGACVG